MWRLNPMGKVPAILHNPGALITEQAAVFIYLADLFPEKGLAPAIGDALRGPYLRWMVFYGSCFEPAVVDRAMKREPAPASTSPYGDYDTMMGTLTDQLAKGPYILGERFSAADVLWGGALGWTTMFKIVEATPLIQRGISTGSRRGPRWPRRLRWMRSWRPSRRRPRRSSRRLLPVSLPFKGRARVGMGLSLLCDHYPIPSCPPP